MVSKLKISKCSLSTTGTATVLSGPTNEFVVMLNPSEYTLNFGIKYNGGGVDTKNEGKGLTNEAPKFVGYGENNVNFDILLDGTGVVPNSWVAPTVLGSDVVTQIESLKGLIYKFDGTNHEPNVVQLTWGNGLSFIGRLTTMRVQYTLFKPTGDPLRAKVNIAVVNYVSAEESALQANTSSPDLTHLVEVKAGDSLPLMCHRIYKNSAYYLEVAKINGITNFRDIKPGTRLSFPPLR